MSWEHLPLETNDAKNLAQSDFYPLPSIFQSVDLHNHGLPKVYLGATKTGHCAEASETVGTLSLAALRRKICRKNAK